MSEQSIDTQDRGSAASVTPAGEASTGELVGRVSEQLSELVRSELELAKAELQVAAKRGGLGVGLFGGAGVLGLYGLGVLIATAVLALALVLPPWLAALIVGVVILAAAGIAALLGKKQVSQVAPPIQDSVDSVKRDVDTVKGNNRK